MRRARIVFLKLATGEGIEGLGEATLEWKTDAIVATLGELERFILGKARFRSGISSIRCTGTLTGGPVRSSALPSQVSLAWLLARDVIVMPASSKIERLRSNFAASKLALSDSEMAEIAALERGERIIDPATAPDWD